MNLIVLFLNHCLSFDIGIERFRILGVCGGQGLEYWGGGKV